MTYFISVQWHYCSIILNWLSQNSLNHTKHSLSNNRTHTSLTTHWNFIHLNRFNLLGTCSIKTNPSFCGWNASCYLKCISSLCTFQSKDLHVTTLLYKQTSLALFSPFTGKSHEMIDIWRTLKELTVCPFVLSLSSCWCVMS